ncbi:MAG: GNAT family N-acetyltransferase [Thermomicrobiales bacterium]
MPEAATTATTTETPKIQGPDKQTALVGELVYLRPLNEDDAATGTSWRNTLFPQSTSRVETWIEENLGKEDPEKKESLAIVRKSDDLVVGSLVVEHEPTASIANAHVAPVYGEAGLCWKGEALALVAKWIVDERHALIMHLDIPATETPVIAAIEAAGMRQTARFREKRFIDGVWVDELLYDYVNPGWMQRLGDPMAIELPRSGNGEPRPVPAKANLAGDPPRGTIMIGERVYLRAFEKKDADEIARWDMRDPEAFFSLGRGAQSPAATKRQLLEQQNDDPPETVSLSVCLRENDEFIGSVELMDIDYVHRNAETGSWLARVDYRGSGYGSEAKHLLLAYAFDRLRLHMVHSWVLFHNTRSAAALRKQGYRESGRANWLFTHEGKLGNMVLFDLLAGEWRAMPRRTS